MAQNITLLGASYSDVPSVELPKTGGGTAQFDDTTIASNAASASDITSGKLAFVNGELVTGTASGGGATLITKSITANGTYNASSDNADGYSSVTVNVSGGGGSSNWTLLKTELIGAVSHSSTTALNLNKSISVTDCGDYDILVVYASVDSLSATSHGVTATFVCLGNTYSSKTAANPQLYWNAYTNNVSKLINSRSATTSSGVYPSNPTISSGTVTLPMYAKYNSTYTKTINGTYTAKVYGIKLFDLYGA